MPTRGAIAIVITVAALVLLINVKTPEPPTTARTGGSSAGVVSNVDGSAGSTPAPTSTATSGTTGTSNAGTTTSGTVDGPVIDMRYGAVQVELVISGGKVTDVVALSLPSGGRSGRISSYAEPILRQEALTAQSAQVDTVSGATYTSDAYAQSLQAALDKAGLP